MPELPEVELHRRHLEKWVVGRTVVDVLLRPAKLMSGTDAECLRENLRGATLLAPRRWGKHLVVPVQQGGALYLHLGMTGHVTSRTLGDPLPRFLSLALTLDDGRVVDLHDARRFSQLGWLTEGQWPRLPETLGLGPDLLDAPPNPTSPTQPSDTSVIKGLS